MAAEQGFTFLKRCPVRVLLTVAEKNARALGRRIHNMLKSTRSQHMSVSTLLNKVDASDEHLEANLCTMLQSMRGTKQYWFLRQSELKCMIREWGSPTVSNI